MSNYDIASRDAEAGAVSTNIARYVSSDDVSSDCESSSNQDGDADSNVPPSQQTSKGGIAMKETQDVRRYKLCIFLFLCIASITLAVFVAIRVRNNETSDFQRAFYGNTQKIFDAIEQGMDNTLVPLDALAVTLVSFAKSQNDTTKWPFVTLPDFGLRMTKLLPQTDGMLISVLPIVQPEDRLQWEIYTSSHNDWVNESLNIQTHWDGYYGNTSFDWEPQNEIVGMDGSDIPSNVSRPMAPQWQTFPISTETFPAYNQDLLSQSNPEYMYTAISNKTCVIKAPVMVARSDDSVLQNETDAWTSYFSNFISLDENPFEPLLELIYPIIDDLSRTNLMESEHEQAVVGVLSVRVYFREFIQSVLTSASDSMIVVVDNVCSDTFTYQLDGPNTTYLGSGDKHQTAFDGLVVTKQLTELYNLYGNKSVYSGVPVDKEYCPYNIRLYPTIVMEKSYRSGKAAIYVLITFMCFAALGFIFQCYDGKVESRQKEIMSVAVKSSEIVTSLFPTSIHDQLFDTTASNDKNDNDSSDQDKNTKLFVSPIAKLYPETTVMFADIKGFTAWSASREPSQVFLLLESIYSSFDAIADGCGVFKVETIGDTYVAVAGLPNPRKDHAITMAKFAKRCIEKMSHVVKELAITLGPETLNLSIRVGLNSGPTTAGVLRGAKARFQLFGDTVNTASRMESTGESNKIHVSALTAHILEHAGKGHWLTLREEALSVKGKGMMQTYWCNPKLRLASSESHASSYGTDNDDDGINMNKMSNINNNNNNMDTNYEPSSHSDVYADDY